MGVFHSWNRTWIFEMEIDALPMGCWIAKYPEPLQKLDKLACVRAFPQTAKSSLTTIHPINTTELLFNYRVWKILVVWRHHYSLLSILPFRVCSLHISNPHTLFSTHPSLSQISKALSGQDNIEINLQSPH